jgi:hypothetical protein
MVDVLNQLKQKTGATFDMPPASNERVVGQFGPGAPRDVIAQLLNGSHYDYVLMGSPADPGSLKKVILMARASGPEPAPQPQTAPNQEQSLQAVPEIEQDQSSEDTAPDVQPEIPQAMESQQQPDQEEPAGQPPPGAPNGGPVVKTPEQLLRELQQQQQQQQNQGQPPQ